MIEKLKTIGFRDTYRVLNRDAGLTEDTDTNMMRYNQKLIEKHYRFDGIFYLPSIDGWKHKKSSVLVRKSDTLAPKTPSGFTMKCLKSKSKVKTFLP